MGRECRRSLYHFAECSAGGEELVLLLFGRGSKPDAKQNRAIEKVTDHGDGTWTAVLRDARRKVGDMSPKNLGNFSFFNNGTAVKNDVVSASKTSVISKDRGTLPKNGPKKDLSAIPEKTELVADFSHIPVGNIEKIVVHNEELKRESESSRVSEFYKQSDNFYERRPHQHVEIGAHYTTPAGTAVKELDTIAFGKVDAFVLDNNIEASVWSDRACSCIVDGWEKKKNTVHPTQTLTQQCIMEEEYKKSLFTTQTFGTIRDLDFSVEDNELDAKKKVHIPVFDESGHSLDVSLIDSAVSMGTKRYGTMDQLQSVKAY